jgi:hypothetical protein
MCENSETEEAEGHGIRFKTEFQAEDSASARDPQSARGSLSKKEIRAVIVRNLHQVRDCYELAQTAWPDVRGKVRVKFVIGPDGRVPLSAISLNQTGIEALGCCIQNFPRHWQFPRPQGGGIVIVDYPFMLENGQFSGAPGQHPGAEVLP